MRTLNIKQLPLCNGIDRRAVILCRRRNLLTKSRLGRWPRWAHLDVRPGFSLIESWIHSWMTSMTWKRVIPHPSLSLWFMCAATLASSSCDNSFVLLNFPANVKRYSARISNFMVIITKEKFTILIWCVRPRERFTSWLHMGYYHFKINSCVTSHRVKKLW